MFELLVLIIVVVTMIAAIRGTKATEEDSDVTIADYALPIIFLDAMDNDNIGDL